MASLIPITILEATTAVQMGLNVLIEIIMGYTPGNPHALMIIKAFGYNIDGQADSYVGNLKIGPLCKDSTKGVVSWSIDNGLCSNHSLSRCP